MEMLLLIKKTFRLLLKKEKKKKEETKCFCWKELFFSKFFWAVPLTTYIPFPLKNLFCLFSILLPIHTASSSSSSLLLFFFCCSIGRIHFCYHHGRNIRLQSVFQLQLKLG